MHRNTTRQLLAGAQRYICPSCSLKITAQALFRPPYQSRPIVLPNPDPTVSKFLSLEAGKSDKIIDKRRVKKKGPRQDSNTSPSTSKTKNKIDRENLLSTQEGKERKNRGECSIEHLSLNELLVALKQTQERVDSLSEAPSKSEKGKTTRLKNLSLKSINVQLERIRRIKKEIQSRPTSEKSPNNRNEVQKFVSTDERVGLGTSKGSPERREYLVDPSENFTQPDTSDIASRRLDQALESLKSRSETGEGNRNRRVGTGRLTQKLRFVRIRQKATRKMPASHSPVNTKKPHTPFRMLLVGESTTPPSKIPARSQGQQTSRRRRDGVGSAKTQTVTLENISLIPIDAGKDQPPVPTLAYGLDRVLFNPGVYHLQDPRSKVYNFDPYLQTVMPVSEFDFNSLGRYVTSSQDRTLEKLAKSTGRRYIGSTSSLSSVLSHFHYLLSQWRPVNVDRLSKTFPAKFTSFTELQRGPAAIFLKWQDGTYAIDADKELETANILSMLGKSMEKLLTLDTDAFERYRRSNPTKLTDEEREVPEAYHFSTLGDFLIRSQLDAHDCRLPGTGMFDLKTRAVLSVRMNVKDYETLKGYEIRELFGEYESFEREYYDMIRAAFLKYSLQVRMGRMDGIFVAYHNTERIFGFQYIPLSEMDLALHGQTDLTLGDEELKHSFVLLNKVLDKVTQRFPEQSVRIHIETRETQENFMYIFAEPVTADQMRELQSAGAKGIQTFEREVLGLYQEPGAELSGDQRDIANNNSYDDLGDGEPIDTEDADNHFNDTTLSQRHDISATVAHGETALPTWENTPNMDNGDLIVQKKAACNEPPASGNLAFGAEMELKATTHFPSSPQGSTIGEALTESGTQHRETKNQLRNATEITSEDDTKDEEDEYPESDSHDSSKPILGMTLSIKNKVGGKSVIRPEKITGSSAPWSIEYSLSEIPSLDRAWVLYRMCQKRRKKALSDESNELKYNNPFMRHIRDLSQSRTKLREKQNEAERENRTKPIIFEESRTLRGENGM